MRYDVQKNVEKKNIDHKNRRTWYRVVTCLAVVVAFCTVYALILPAITQEGKVSCGLEEHVHDESCYTLVDNDKLICNLTESDHAHTESCYAVVRNQDATEGHIHSDSCYTIQPGELVCKLPETEGHIHSETCYMASLICQENSDTHVHSDSCYEDIVMCGITEAEPHTHNDNCYAQNKLLTCGLEEVADSTEKELICTEQEFHAHTPECYQAVEQQLICEEIEGEQHVHHIGCYNTAELTCIQDEHIHDAMCFNNPEEDLETADIWEQSFADIELTGIWSKDVLAIAESQLGYKESTKNYIIGVNSETREEARKGITRYGQWYGNPYDDWCAMFASFCISHAEVEGMPLEADVGEWICKLSAEDVNLYHKVGEYDPKPSDLIFLNCNDDEEADRVGIVAEVIPAMDEVPAKIKVIEGDSSDIVQYVTYEVNDTQIIGFGKLAEQLERTYQYADDDVQVKVALPVQSEVEKDAVLKVTEIQSEDNEYAGLERKAEEAVEGEVKQVKFYDISFYTEDEEYIPVDDKAKVTMQFTEQVMDSEAEVAILHFEDEEDAPAVIEEVSVGDGTESVIETLTDMSTKAVEDDSDVSEETTSDSVAENTGTEIVFETDGFSTFAIVQVEIGMYRAEIISPETDDTNLVWEGEKTYDTIAGVADNKKQYIIVSADMKYALSSYVRLCNDGEDKLKGMEVLQYDGKEAGADVYVNANKHLLWEFEDTEENGLVYIKSVATDEYLQLARPKVAITSELNDGDPDNRQMIHTFKDDDTDKVGFCVNVNDAFYYLNRDGAGENYHTWNPTTFEGSSNNQFYLCEYKGLVDDSNELQSTSGVNINNADMTYIIAGVNYDGFVDNTGNPPTVLTGTKTTMEVDIGNEKIEDVDGLLGNLASGVTIEGNKITSITYVGGANENYIWKFEKDANMNNNDYYVNLVGTEKYLFINQYKQGIQLSDFSGRQKVTMNDAVINEIEGAIIREDVVTFSRDRHYLFLYGNAPGNAFTALDTYIGNNVTNANYQTHMVRIEYGQLVEGLEEKSYIISGVNCANDTGGAAVLTMESGKSDANGLDADMKGLRSEAASDVTITNQSITNLITQNDPRDYAWQFLDAGYGVYHIKSVKTGKYLNIADKSLTLGENAQDIEVIVAHDSPYEEQVKKNRICLRSKDGNYIVLRNNAIGNSFTGENGTLEHLGDNRASALALTEYDMNLQSVSLATDLGGKVYLMVGVNNRKSYTNGMLDEDNNYLPALTAIPSVTAGQLDVQRIKLAKNIISNPSDNLSDMIKDFSGEKFNFAVDDVNFAWVFEQTDTPGVYHVRVVTEDSTTPYYLNIKESPALAISNTPTDIEVIKADTTNLSDDINGSVTTENVIALRTKINGIYYYVHLGEGNHNYVNSGFHGKPEMNITKEATHLALVEIKEVNTVVTKINTLLDNLVENSGEYSFSKAGYIGSASPDNANKDEKQGNGDDSHVQPFVDDYDQAQKYRREMQLLAREIKTLYDGLLEEEQKYVYRYDIVQDKLKWLWDTVEAVEPDNPTGVTVRLFNYDSTIADQKFYNEGFYFYHRRDYDEYTIVDQGRKINRNRMLGCDDSELIMYDTLTEDGYPSVHGGTGKPITTDADGNVTGGFSKEDGSLAYLFSDDNNSYHKATMTDGGGLFQKDENGYYYYYCNQNSAWYNAEDNKFELYDTAIRPMYIHGSQPDTADDVYNFLPFNSPYDDLIFDEPDTIPANHIGANNGDKTDTDGKVYPLHADSVANTAKSGYLNERADMWFGMNIEFSFLMPSNGQITVYNDDGTVQKDDMVFEFYGDDDIWVYIDDKLVLDLGGVHGAEKATINFKTGEVYFQNQGEDVKKTLGEIFGNISAINGDTFTDNTPHTLKFFYLERGGNVSYCGMKFNMPTLPMNYLAVSKELDNSEVKNTSNVLGKQYYNFRVIQADAEGKAITDSEGNYLSFFEGNTEFSIYEDGLPTGGKGVVDSDGYFSIRAGQQVIFDNILEHRADNNISNYIVQEIFFDSESGQYIEVNCDTEHLQVSDGVVEESDNTLNISKDTLENLVGDVKVEDIAFTTGLKADVSQDIKLTNKLKDPLGELSITKQLAAGSDTTENKNNEFMIKVELGDYVITNSGSGNETDVGYEVVYSPIPQGTEYVLEGVGDTQTVTSTDGTIVLKHGQKVTFKGIVAGTYYRVSEVISNSETWTPVYTGTVEKKDAESNVTTAEIDFNANGENNATGEFHYGDSVSIIITNTDYDYAVNVPIVKRVNHSMETDTFQFSAEYLDGITDLSQVDWENQLFAAVPGTSITVSPENAAGVSGKIVLGFADSAINAMENNTGKVYYRIRELEDDENYLYDSTYYILEITLTKSTAEGVKDAKVEISGVWKNGIDEAHKLSTIPSSYEFTNTRTTSVKIKKTVEGGTVDEDEEFNFTISYAEKSTEVKVKAGEEVEVTDIPVGTIVTVTENENENYKTFYEVYSRYEAENGILSNGAKKNKSASASCGVGVGDIGKNGGIGAVTLPVYMLAEMENKTMKVGYNLGGNRSFGITVNDTEKQIISCTKTGAWNVVWNTFDYTVNLNKGINTITFSGDTGYAPNLDYIDFEWIELKEGNSVAYTVGDITTFHFINQRLYTLPESGGTGTDRYILSGMILMLLSVIFGYSQRCRREKRTEK